MTSGDETIISPEDRKLFSDIAKDIRNNPDKYRDSGKWLDEYCSENAYWQRQKDELAQLRTQEKILPESVFVRRVSQLEKEIQVRRTPALLIRFQEARNYLLEKYKDQQFVPEDDAKRIIIITWLLTDPDTEKSNLNITELEKWSWEPINDVSKLSRGYANFLWFYGGKVYGPWIKLVRIGWEKLAESVGEEVLTADDQKHTLARSFLYNLLKASIKHLPIVGSFLYDVIYGTLDNRSSQKINRPPKLPQTQTTFKKKEEIDKTKGSGKKSSKSTSPKGAKITLIAAIITLVSAILTSPLWRPLIKKWIGDSNVTIEISKEWIGDSNVTTEISPKKKVLNSLKEICQDIDSRPFVQQDETAKRYIGIKIEKERLKMVDVHENSEEGTFTLVMIFPDQPDKLHLTGRQILCTVKKDKYPELNAAKEGLELYVSGQIEDAGRSYIRISNVSLKFD